MGHSLWKMSATICILMGFGIQSIFSINYIKYHLSQETRDTFYLRNIGYYNVVQWINKNLTLADRVANPIRYLNYLLQVPYLYLKSSSQFLIDTNSLNDSERVFKQLKTQRINYIIGWKDIGDILVSKNLFYNKQKFNTVVYISRTLGISKRVTVVVFAIREKK